MITNGIIAIVIGYLLGSIPSAYIAVRLAKGKDIRQMGRGNVGALHAFREVGAGAGTAVLLTDIGKGAAAVAIAQWLLDVPLPFILLTGLAAVAGHNWSIFLKFTGGKGTATALGILAILMPWELLIFFAIALIPIIITRNAALSIAIGLISLPISAWLLEKSGLLVAFSILLLLIIGLKSLPIARAIWTKTENKKELIFSQWQRKQTGKR